VPQELFDIRGAACKITWLACSFSDVTTFTRLCDKLKGRSASNNNVEVEWLASHAWNQAAPSSEKRKPGTTHSALAWDELFVARPPLRKNPFSRHAKAPFRALALFSPWHLRRKFRCLTRTWPKWHQHADNLAPECAQLPKAESFHQLVSLLEKVTLLGANGNLMQQVHDAWEQQIVRR